MKNLALAFGLSCLVGCTSSGGNPSGDRSGGSGGETESGSGGDAQLGMGGSSGDGAGGAESDGGKAGTGGAVTTGGSGGKATGGSGGAGGVGMGGRGGTAGSGGVAGSGGATGTGGMAATFPAANKTPDSVAPGYTVFPFDATEAKRRQTESATAHGVQVTTSVDLGGGVMMDFILVPGGRSRLGSPPGTPGAEPDENQHTENIPRAFYLAKVQITREQYRALMGTENAATHPYVRLGTSPKQPALAHFEEVRGIMTPRLQTRIPSGWTARLITDNEYEHAARAGTGTIWYTGDAEADLAKIGWYDKNAHAIVQDSGQLLPNAWGLYDMVGNTWHWVYRASGPAGKENGYEVQFVRGGDASRDALGNGCRTSNVGISSRPEGTRFLIDIP